MWDFTRWGLEIRGWGARLAIGVCAALMAAAPATAILKPQQTPSLQSAVIASAGFGATVVPEELSKVEGELDTATRTGLSRFRAEFGSSWSVQVDRRSGGMALVEGKGIAWIPGRGNALDPQANRGTGPGGAFTVDDMAAKALDLVRRYSSLFQVAPATLQLDRAGSSQFGPDKEFWSVTFRQVIGGVEVEGARVIFRVAHGNLVQFGVDRTMPTLNAPGAPARTGTPSLSAAAARLRLEAHIGGLQSTDRILENGSLHWVGLGVDDKGRYTGPIGAGWTPVLVYRFTLERAGEPGTWQALVDADKGDVVRFVDANDYVSLVKSSVYTLTNCTDPLNCVPGTAAERRITVPFAGLNFVGATCAGDSCYTNSAGAFAYPAGSVAASTSLDGKYFRVVDACGPVSAAAGSPADIDLGTSDSNPPLNTNTDCQPATRQSPPNSSPTSGGAGDTHSARNTFYHLNLIGQKARAYLPDNQWLKGVEGPGAIPVLSNGPPACNAFWQGTTGSLNFERNTPGLSCNNTGEIPDVFLHEFGHGLDQNDGTGTAPESATGEAMGDTFALLQGQHSCIGTGLFLPSATSPNWGNRAGYGTGSALCSGVRDLDYTRYCYHGTGAGCVVSTDPDAPNGSRSGANPPANPPDGGTSARWSTMIETAPAATADGISNFYNCGGPETNGCAGPLDHGCHCESLIASQANWDLAKTLIASEFGGNAYANPQGPKEVSGWQYMDRLWYLTRDLATSAYSVTGPAPTGTSNGCGAGNWFSTYRFIDDDDGDLSNGTPHADLIFSAFDKHAIACGAAADPTNQASGCSTPVAAPTLTTCDQKAPVQLNWTASAGATKYRVLRNTLGCEFGFTPLATVTGGRQYYEDADVAPGVPYYYSIQPVGASDSCYGQVSNCVQVVPTTCGAVAVAPPATLTASAPSDNQISLSWSAAAGAGSYKILRREGDCNASGTFSAIQTVAAPATTYVDTDAISGGVTYSYRVATSDASCAACTSAPSSCASITATGACHREPVFGGVTSVGVATNGACSLTVHWAAGTSLCGPGLVYDVFRGTSPDFIAGPSSRIAMGVSGTSYVDVTVSSGVRYYYSVRAVDSAGNADDNTARVSEIASGGLTPGTYTDNAGDTTAAKLIPSPTLGNTWTIRPSGPGNATRHYATTASGIYADNSCMGLETNTVFLGANSSLSFRTSYDMETGWDGGYVEVATEAGGYSNWTKLDTISYPGVMVGPLGDPACGGAGFADGSMVFTGQTGGQWTSFSGSLSAYSNQRVRIRFLFSSDASTGAGGWLIDDIAVSNAMLPGTCVREDSPLGQPRLMVAKRPDGSLDLIFEDLPGATSYNVYSGTIGTWYSHQSALCHDASSTPGVPATGQRTLSAFSPPQQAAYFLVNGSNQQAEGILGFDSQGHVIPLPASPCGPTP